MSFVSKGVPALCSRTALLRWGKDDFGGRCVTAIRRNKQQQGVNAQ